MPTLKYKDPITGEYKSDIHVVGAVSSVNGKTGVVELTNSDIPNAITDVQINNASLVVDGVASIPVALQTSIDARASGRVLQCSDIPYAVKSAMTSATDQTWTASEQAAARERLGAERRKTFELIETIALTEDTASILRSSEPNGTPYDFESVVVEIDQTNATTKQQLDGWVRINHDKPSSDWVYAAHFSGDSSVKYYCIFYKLTDDGSVESGAFRAASSSNTGALSQQINTIPSNIFRATRVSHLNIYSVSPYFFSAGTVIKIHGVRA